MFPVYLAQAGAPLLASWIWQIGGDYDLLELVLLASAAVSAISFVLAARLRPDRVRTTSTHAEPRRTLRAAK